MIQVNETKGKGEKRQKQIGAAADVFKTELSG